MTVLVTGGTGTVGRPTVDAFRARGTAPRILSRRPGVDHRVADLRTGNGLDAALAGVGTVVHLATNRRDDRAATVRQPCGWSRRRGKRVCSTSCACRSSESTPCRSGTTGRKSTARA